MYRYWWRDPVALRLIPDTNGITDLFFTLGLLDPVSGTDP